MTLRISFYHLRYTNSSRQAIYDIFKNISVFTYREKIAKTIFHYEGSGIV